MDHATGNCGACGSAIGSGDGAKGRILAALKHIRECPALKPEERQAVIEMTLALLELLRRA